LIAKCSRFDDWFDFSRRFGHKPANPDNSYCLLQALGRWRNRQKSEFSDRIQWFVLENEEPEFDP
jgi:hypothetical protein